MKDLETRLKEALDLLEEASDKVWGEVPMSDLAEDISRFLHQNGRDGTPMRYDQFGRKILPEG